MSACLQTSISGISSNFSLHIVNFIYQDIEYKYNECYSKLSEEARNFEDSIPTEILDMKIGDLKKMVTKDWFS